MAVIQKTRTRFLTTGFSPLYACRTTKCSKEPKFLVETLDWTERELKIFTRSIFRLHSFVMKNLE
jgi:hypothetical protein